MLYYLFNWLEAEFNIPGAGLFSVPFIPGGHGHTVFPLIISIIFGKRNHLLPAETNR